MIGEKDQTEIIRNGKSLGRSKSGSPQRRRLGGPVSPITNYMIGVSRSKRDIVYCKEAENSFKGRNVPGPGSYNSHEIVAIKYGNKNHFSIPKVSHFKLIIL